MCTLTQLLRFGVLDVPVRLTALAVLMLIPVGISPAGAGAPSPTQDLALGPVTVAETDLAGLRHTFGEPSCILTDPSHEFATYVFAGSRGAHLVVQINTLPSHVDYQHVEGLTLSQGSRHVGRCGASSAAAPAALLPAIATAQGITLGDPLEKVVQAYGTPKTMRSEGAQTRLVYLRDDTLPHAYQWELLFEHGRLIEWTVRSFPVFVEAPG